MGVYKKTIMWENLRTEKAANDALLGFFFELFRELGYDVKIEYKDNILAGKREMKATWERLKPRIHYEQIVSKSPEELKEWFCNAHPNTCSGCPFDGIECTMLDWLREEVAHD